MRIVRRRAVFSRFSRGALVAAVAWLASHASHARHASRASQRGGFPGISASPHRRLAKGRSGNRVAFVFLGLRVSHRRRRAQKADRVSRELHDRAGTRPTGRAARVVSSSGSVAWRARRLPASDRHPTVQIGIRTPIQTVKFRRSNRYYGDVARLATRVGCEPMEAGSIPVRHPAARLRLRGHRMQRGLLRNYPSVSTCRCLPT